VNARSLAVLGLTVAVFLAMGGWAARHLELATGVTHFLSAGTDAGLARISRQLADSAPTRTMVLSVGAPELPTAIAAAREWGRILEQNPEAESVRTGPGQDLAPTVFELYFPRRFLFLSPRPETELPVRLSDGGLRETARQLRAELALPEAPLTQKIAGSDPLLAFPSLLRRFEEARLGGLQVVEGAFVDGDASHAILLLTTRHSAFDASHQAPLERSMERSFADLDRHHGGVLELERSAVHRFAAAAERRARQDLTRISSVSAAGIALLFLAVFRSPILLLLSMLPLVGGVLAALVVCICAFQELHAVTLVFGATLIGVCIDYPIHYVNHRLLFPGGGDTWAALRRVGPALAMGASTTVAGFLGLAWSDFPGIFELAVFAGVGVLAALFATCSLLPPLAPARSRSSGLQRRLAEGFAHLLDALRRRPLPLAALPFTALVLCLAGLPRISWQDDLSALSLPLDPEWVAEDARVRARVSRMEEGRFVLALAQDDETALRRNDAAHARLTAAREQGQLEDFRSLHAFLWSRDLQTRNFSALAAIPGVGARAVAALDAEGFRPEAFAGFVEALSAPPPKPLALDDLLDSPLAPLLHPFYVELDDGVGLLTYLRGVSDPAALERAFAGLDGVHYFDQDRFLAEVYGRYRTRASALILAGLVAVVALLQLRYRRLRLSFAAAAPAMLAAASTLALLSLLGVPVSLLHLLGSLLVLSFGVDYGIFLVESRGNADTVAASTLSIAVACASTCLSFGLLATSSFPALRDLGATTALGVLFSLILAPTALLLSEPAPWRKASS
jgi:predicted exporter